MRVLVRCAALLVAVASPVAAQSPIGVGTSAGVVKLTDQRSEEALSGVLEYQPNPWLSLYAIPAVLHLSDNVNGRPVSSSGLGSGQTAAGLDLGVAISPRQAHLAVDASRSLSGVSAQSSLDAPKATALHFEAGYDVAPRWTWTASVGVDVGSDSTQALSRVIGAGVRHTLAHSLMVTIDGSHGLTAASPRWILSVGVGTAFGGSSPVTPTTPLRRLKSTFNSGNTAKIGCR